MADGEDVIAILNEKLREMQAELKAANGESMERKAALKEVTRELDSLKSERERLTKDFDALKAAPTEAMKELEMLKAERRATTLKKKFEEVSAALGVRPEAVADLMSLSGYKSDTDVIDEGAVKAAIEGTVKDRAYLLQPAEPTPVQGLGVSKGTAPSGFFAPTPEQLSDPKWLFSNQQKLADAHRSGQLHV